MRSFDRRLYAICSQARRLISQECSHRMTKKHAVSLYAFSYITGRLEFILYVTGDRHESVLLVTGDRPAFVLLVTGDRPDFVLFVTSDRPEFILLATGDRPEFVLLVTCLNVLDEFVETARVFHLDLGALPVVVLQLDEHSHVRVLTYVQAALLLAHLSPDLCNTPSTSMRRFSLKLQLHRSRYTLQADSI